MASALLVLFAYGTPVPAVYAKQQDLDRDFKAAVGLYEAGKYPEAAAQLEKLVRKVPESFEVQELLGLVYSAQSQDTRATQHLQKAVTLKPDSAPARTNLATNLAHLGKTELATEQFRKAVELDPQNFETNHNLGEAFARSGRVAEAALYLEKAQQIDPSSYDNGYDLSLAYLQTRRLADAQRLLENLLKQKNTAELHNLLAEVEEKDGKFVEAANEYEAAAHLEPSESNLFDWGSELLLHRTLDPAVEVFKQGVQRYPASQRMVVGLGMTYYARGNYDDSVKSLLRAADLNPSEPSCYFFLSKAYDSSPSRADEVIQRFRRFAELQPKNARALYYYAMSLWKGRRAQDPGLDLHQIESLLTQSLATRINMWKRFQSISARWNSIPIWPMLTTGWGRRMFAPAKRAVPRSSFRSTRKFASSIWRTSRSSVRRFGSLFIRQRMPPPLNRDLAGTLRHRQGEKTRFSATPKVLTRILPRRSFCGKR